MYGIEWTSWMVKEMGGFLHVYWIHLQFCIAVHAYKYALDFRQQHFCHCDRSHNALEEVSILFCSIHLLPISTLPIAGGIASAPH